MNKLLGKRLLLTLSAIMFLLCFFKISNNIGVKADTNGASMVSVGDIDYDKLTMKVYKNGNNIVYFSPDSRKTWLEVEGESGNADASGSYVEMDISWVNSKSDTSVYFKGDKEPTALEVSFPKMNTAFKVTFNKATLDFSFDGYDEATKFMWRKASDYQWYEVPFDTSSSGYKLFLETINNLRFKGCKLIFRCGQVIGTSAENVGQRMSSEVKVSIPKIANAPSVKINVKKFNLNTKTSQEYYNGSEWVTCEKNMSISDIAPDTLYKANKDGSTVVLKIRNKATEKASYSKTTIITIPGQTKAPNFGEGGDVKVGFSTDKKKFVLTFTKASAASPIDYCIVTPGKEFDVSKVKWKSVKSENKEIKLAQKSLPEGSKIYIRYSGIAANEAKNISLKLPSYYAEYTVPAWPKTETKTNSTTK